MNGVGTTEARAKLTDWTGVWTTKYEYTNNKNMQNYKNTRVRMNRTGFTKNHFIVKLTGWAGLWTTT